VLCKSYESISPVAHKTRIMSFKVCTFKRSSTNACSVVHKRLHGVYARRVLADGSNGEIGEHFHHLQSRWEFFTLHVSLERQPLHIS
jgi:hypothetical protein